jgi:jumonji domain-containing protein 7
MRRLTHRRSALRSCSRAHRSARSPAAAAAPAAELEGGTVPRLRVPRGGAVDALSFARDHIGPNRPLVLEGAAAAWPALTRWTPAGLRAAAGGAAVSVAWTPDGCGADAPAPCPRAGGGGGAELFFAHPLQRRMALSSFLDALRASAAAAAGPVPYLQAQNSSLSAELPALAPDIAPGLPWADAAFGAPPEAVNIWLGGARSVTAWHRDHYENLYACVQGEKHFRLLPPGDAYRLALRRLPVAEYVEDAGVEAAAAEQAAAGLEEGVEGHRGAPPRRLRLAPRAPREELFWSAVRPRPAPDSPPFDAADAAARALLDDPALPRPLEVTLRPGDVLYLPSCWYHEVRQSPPAGDPGAPCAAVNFWFDMRFGARFVHGARAGEAWAAVAGTADAPPAG